MRTFRKILACFLAVVLTVTILPLSVFADPPAAEEPAAPAAASGYALPGNVPDGTVTVTLSLDKLRELLSDTSDLSGLLDSIKDFVEVNGNVITLEELMEIVPMQSLFDIILGENYSKVPDLIERLGGMDVILEMVNPTELIMGISSENMAALMTYVSSIDGIETVLRNVNDLLALNITIKDFAYVLNTYMDQNKLKTRANRLTSDNINSVFQDGHGIEDIIDMASFRTAVLAGLKNNTIRKNNGDPLTFADIIDLTKVNFSEFEAEINAALADDAVKDSVLDGLIAEDILDIDTITSLSGINVQTDAMLDNETAVVNYVKAALLEEVGDGAGGTTLRILQILTTAGVNKLLKDKLPADAVSQILSNADYYNGVALRAWAYENLNYADIKSFVSLETLKANGDIVDAAKAILQADFDADATLDKSANRLTTEILKEAGKTALTAAYAADPSMDVGAWLLAADASYYNENKVVDLLWEAADDANVELADLVDFDTLKTDAAIQTKLQTKLATMTAEEIRTLVTGAGIRQLFGGMTFTDGDLTTMRSNTDYYNGAPLAELVKKAAKACDTDLKQYYEITSIAALLENVSIKNFMLNHLFEYVDSAEIADSIDGAKLWSYLKDDFNPFAVTDLVNLALDKLNWNKVTDSEIVKVQTLLDILLGAEPITVLLKDEYSLTDLIRDENVIDLAEVFEKIRNSEQGLTHFVNLTQLINKIPGDYYPTLFGYFNKADLIAQLKDDWRTFYDVLTNREKSDVVQTLVANLIDKVDLIKLQGETVGQEDEIGALSINVEKLAETVLKLIPTLEDLSNLSEEGVLLAFNLQVKYRLEEKDENGDDVFKTKNVDFRLVLEDGLDYIRRAATVLKRYIIINVDGTDVSVEINVPVLLEKIYARAAQADGTPAQVALKEKLLKAEGMTGDELLTLLSDTPLSEIIDALDDVDLNALYRRAVNSRYAEKVVEKFNDYTGSDYDLSTLGSIDDLVDATIDGGKLPSIERIVEKLSDKTGKDLMPILEKVAKASDQNTYVNKLLDRVAQIDRLAPYVEGISAEKILDTYKGYDPVHAVAQFIKDETGRDVLKKIQSYDSVQSIYESALNKVQSRFTGAYNRAVTLIRNLADENYESDNRFVALLQAYLPTRAINAFLNRSINDLYRGDGVFATNYHSRIIPVEKIVNRVMNAVQGRVPQLDNAIVNTIRGIFSVNSIKVGGSAKVNFQRLRQVTFQNADGSHYATTYLPIGVDPAKALSVPEVAGKVAVGWSDQTGAVVTQITKDKQVLTALYTDDITEKYTVTYWFFNGTALEEAALQTFAGLKAGDPVPALTNVPGVPDTFAPGVNYKMVWYAGKGTAGDAVADPTTYAVGTGDLDFTVAYVPDSFTSDVSFSFESVQDPADGKYIWTVTLNDDDIDLKIDMSKLPDTDVLKELVIKNKDGSVEIALGKDMLDKLKEKYPDATIELKAEKKDTVDEFSFENAGTKIYTCSNGLRYTFDLLVNGTAYNKDTFGEFPDDLEITLVLPAENAPILSGTSQHTAIHFIEGGKVQESTTITNADPTTRKITFHLDHFSDYAIVNEYKLTPYFDGASGTVTLNGWTLPEDGTFIPAGATVLNVYAKLDDAHANKRITTLKLNDAVNNTELASLTRKNDFVMQNSAVRIQVNTSELGFVTFWMVDQTHIYTTQAEAETYLATVVLPAGYEFRKDGTGAYIWDNNQNPADVKKDVYRTPVVIEKVYTVTFVPGQGQANIPRNFTVSQIDSFVAPIGANVTGKVFTTWNLGDQTLAAILGDIVNGTKADAYALDAQYVAIEYDLTYADGTTASVAYATDVNPTDHFALSATDEIDEIYYVTGEGTRTKVAYGATFPMPAATVRIEISVKPKTLSITLTNEADGSSQTVNAVDGADILIPIALPAGQALATAPANGKLVSIIANGDGTRTLVYEIAKTSLGAGNTVSYRTAAQSAGQTELSVGDKNATPKGVAYEGAVASEQTAFVTASYAFATYKTTQTRNSLLWLWILLIILLICVIIGILYSLYIHGKIKGCFFMAVIVFLATLFLNICLAWANLILAIERLFTGRKKEDDYKAHGVEDPQGEEPAEESAAPAEDAPAEETEKTSEEEQ